MARIDYTAFTDIIRSRVSAEDLAKDYGLHVDLSGRCPCVFCSGGRDDTLRLYPGDRGYYCFRCHERGDVISLYQKLTGNGFRQAIEDLNSQYGLGLPLSHADQQAMEKAKEEAHKRKLERLKQQQKERELFEKYLDAADTVYLLEKLKKETAPETLTEPWKQRFVISLRYLDEMRDCRDRLYDEIHKV